MLSNDEYCAALKLRISTAYMESKKSCGWRLLASPSSVLEGADVAFIGLNPGGSSQPDDHAEFAMKQGSAYVVETWGGCQPGTGPLQQQVRALFTGLSVKPESVLAGNLVPFRSPSWKSLQRKDFSLKFGESLRARHLRGARRLRPDNHGRIWPVVAAGVHLRRRDNRIDAIVHRPAFHGLSTWS